MELKRNSGFKFINGTRLKAKTFGPAHLAALVLPKGVVTVIFINREGDRIKLKILVMAFQFCRNIFSIAVIGR